MGVVTRGERPPALLPAALAITILAFVLSTPGPATAAPVPPSAVLPAELGASEVLPVSRRKTLIMILNRATDRALVFGSYIVNDYRAGWTKSWSNSTRWGSTESHDAKSTRSFTFALHGGAAPLLAECDERAVAAATGERDDPARRVVPDHSLRCGLDGAGGPFELSVVNSRGELVGVSGERFAVSALRGAASRWEGPPTVTGLLLRAPSGSPVAAVDFRGEGLVVLERGLQPPGRELLAAAAAALLLADLERW
jgi:hypothetical protein